MYDNTHILPPVLERAGVTLDLPGHQASRDGRFLALSPKEFAVLMRAEGDVVKNRVERAITDADPRRA